MLPRVGAVSSQAIVMENAMLRVTMNVSAGLMSAVVLLSTGAVSAAPSEQPAKPACITAEVNPVTGHVLCIEPLGAAVEPPPPEAALPCKAAGRREGAVELQPELHA